MHISTKCHQTLDGFLAELLLYHKVSVEQLDLVAETYYNLVTTEYFLWVDDDFIIRSKTDLRFMLKVIKQTGYDVIGAGVSRSGESRWVRLIN